MGEWDIYCAICGAPFSSRVDIDPKGTKQNHYRYEILKNSSLKWLDEVRALGINADSPATDRSYLTGLGCYSDMGCIDVAIGNDPNLVMERPDLEPQEEINLVAYQDYNDEEAPHVFPFHSICYEDILLRCVWKVSRQLQRQVLFNAFKALHDWGHVRLNVDYGAPSPPEEQYWEANKGEEVLVVNPVKIPELYAHLGRITKYRGMSDKTAAKAGPRQHEVFSRLPIELRHEIFRALPVGSILSLKAASAVMHATPLPARVWRRKLECEVPWLWELADCDVFQSQEVESQASELLLNIDCRSRYAAENDDYVFGLANRRRIWGVCEQIRSKYLELLEGVSVLEG
ncbi:uncharacterized protein BO66DRAFT_329571 [Aspergillus aculeatinus CBS 121060]|uniref:Uncharacterized protein n=1 Tax=Aspergillus aculeatinus CBS 121060 TaxID=1448322 RepID=A0ACD1H160_9EURO|nr:hypothetical protein BO66DRAFT_329571 [Aspergillus aculeatinus CBS 121060]RAH67272.1 hypothetical protein BO66DRAFT_329571 [Aspergillus aculeatinus CBS 121060]